MDIEIQARGFALTDALDQHIRRRLQFAPDLRCQPPQRVIVRLADLNWPHGGEDKCCNIQLCLPGQSYVIIGETHSELVTAIERAAERACRALQRSLQRQRKTSWPRTMRHSGMEQGIDHSQATYQESRQQEAVA